MINTNLLSSSSRFFLSLRKSFKKIYQNSNFYDKKISKVKNNIFEYKPSPYLLSSNLRGLLSMQEGNLKPYSARLLFLDLSPLYIPFN